MSDQLASDNKWAQIPEWVINLDISHTAFRLYAVLARYADNVTGEAFPARDTLANRLSCSVKTIDRAVLDLVEHGAVEKVNRGRYQSATYTVITAMPQVSSVSGDESKVSSEWTNLSRRGDKNDYITRTNELEPLNTNSDFETFWQAYPKKADRRVAEEAFVKALKRTNLDTLMAGVLQYSLDPARKPEFTKNPGTWLNADAWANAPLVAPEPLNDWGKPFGKPAESPGQREWVRASHDRGEHWECRPGEFGHSASQAGGENPGAV